MTQFPLQWPPFLHFHWSSWFVAYYKFATAKFFIIVHALQWKISWYIDQNLLSFILNHFTSLLSIAIHLIFHYDFVLIFTCFVYRFYQFRDYFMIITVNQHSSGLSLHQCHAKIPCIAFHCFDVLIIFNCLQLKTYTIMTYIVTTYMIMCLCTMISFWFHVICTRLSFLCILIVLLDHLKPYACH